MTDEKKEDEGVNLAWLDWLTIGIGVVCVGIIVMYWITDRNRRRAAGSPDDLSGAPPSGEDQEAT